jgi:hypothetical protein
VGASRLKGPNQRGLHPSTWETKRKVVVEAEASKRAKVKKEDFSLGVGIGSVGVGRSIFAHRTSEVS